ncbi:MAG TPA: PAS domain-containing protein, partial [Burkholderiales bacterium]|nr:PAS domain-containing protein [Burkholderiales bacterium]
MHRKHGRQPETERPFGGAGMEKKALRILFLAGSLPEAERMKLVLSGAGIAFTSVLAETREAFVSALDDFHPDIAICRSEAPGFDGMSAIRAAKQILPDVPVIIVTRPLQDLEAVQLVQAGARDYLHEGNLDRLSSAILRVLEQEQRLRESRAEERVLRENNRIFDRICDSTHFGVVYLDGNFNFIRVNRAYAYACGHPAAYFRGKNHFELYPSEENEAIFRKVVETGEPFRFPAKPLSFPDHPEWGVTYWDWTLNTVRS